jgi:hypothetical protein
MQILHARPETWSVHLGVNPAAAASKALQPKGLWLIMTHTVRVC